MPDDDEDMHTLEEVQEELARIRLRDSPLRRTVYENLRLEAVAAGFSELSGAAWPADAPAESIYKPQTGTFMAIAPAYVGVPWKGGTWRDAQARREASTAKAAPVTPKPVVATPVRRAAKPQAKKPLPVVARAKPLSPAELRALEQRVARMEASVGAKPLTPAQEEMAERIANPKRNEDDDMTSSEFRDALAKMAATEPEAGGPFTAALAAWDEEHGTKDSGSKAHALSHEESRAIARMGNFGTSNATMKALQVAAFRGTNK